MFKITAKEKQMIIRRRKMQRSKVTAKPEDVARALEKLMDYFESGTSRIEKLGSLVRRLNRNSPEGKYYADMLSRIEEGLSAATEDMETLRNEIMEGV